MAKVQSSRAKIYETKATFADEPTEHVESAGERLIKELVHKQLDTKLNLQQQLVQRKEFKSSTEIVPLTKYTSGKTSLKEFQDSAKKASYIEELKSFGLTSEEIDLILDYEKGEEEFAEKYKKMERSILSSRLLLIHSKIEQGKKEWESIAVESGLQNVSRHEQELGLCVKPNSEHTKLLHFALSCRPSTVDQRPSNHPINQLKDIEDDLFGHLKKTPHTSKRKRKDAIVQPTSDETPFSSGTNSELSYIYNPQKPSLWDVKGSDTTLTSCQVKQIKEPTVVRVYSCKPETFYTVQNNKIVLLDKAIQQKPVEKPADTANKGSGQTFVVPDIKQSNIEFVSLSDIEKNRITLEEIKSLPRFKDYNEGSPSKVLYLKNLAGSVTEDDLVSLFGQFENLEQHRITYRLLNGKMRGQAFITFPSIETAKAGLESVNGYILKQKPVIIQYGKGAS